MPQDGQRLVRPEPGERRDALGRADALDEVEVAHLAGESAGAAQQPPAEHDASAEALAREQGDVVVRGDGRAAPALGERGEIRVVVDDRLPAPVREAVGEPGVHHAPEVVVALGRPAEASTGQGRRT